MRFTLSSVSCLQLFMYLFTEQYSCVSMVSCSSRCRHKQLQVNSNLYPFSLCSAQLMMQLVLNLDISLGELSMITENSQGRKKSKSITQYLLRLPSAPKSLPYILDTTTVLLSFCN